MTDRIVVAGIPRCGTTMVWRAIVGLPPGDEHPQHYRGSVLKMHGTAPTSLPPCAKGIFMFGDVTLAVISTRFNRWDQRHFANCGCDRTLDEVDIFREDALNYEAMFDSWHQRNGYPVLCLRYETLRDHRDLLSSFVGFDVPLPPWRKRSTTAQMASQADVLAIQQIYEGLIKKVETAPDAAIHA